MKLLQNRLVKDVIVPVIAANMSICSCSVWAIAAEVEEQTQAREVLKADEGEKSIVSDTEEVVETLPDEQKKEKVVSDTEEAVTVLEDEQNKEEVVSDTEEAVAALEDEQKKEEVATDTEEAVQVLQDEQKKVELDATATKSENEEVVEEPFVASDPAVTVDSGEGVDGMTMLYIGGGIAAVAGIGALAFGGGSGGSSTTTTTTTTDSSSSTSTDSSSSTSLVGPNLNGSNWSGYLNLKDNRAEGYQNITASIVHEGAAVQITTTSTLKYGQQFSGRISSNGYMLLYDSVTGEDWTTHYSNAVSTQIDLYDYVNNLTELDRMFLGR